MQQMKHVLIEAKTLPEAWFLCIREVMNVGREYLIDAGSFAGQRRKEFELVTIRVEYPHSRPLVPDTPQGIPPPTTMGYVEGYLPYLMTTHKGEGEDYTYGEDLGPQIPEVIARYKQWGPNQNRCCMTVGSRHSLFEYRKEEQTGQKASSQCLRVVDTQIIDGALHFVTYWRSWDLWAGFPANMAAMQLVKEYVVSEIPGVKDGELWAISKGLHLYGHCWELANAVLGRRSVGTVEIGGVITKANRYLGTDKVMVYGPISQVDQLYPLLGRQYIEVRDTVLKLSDGETKFYHRIPPCDPIQPVGEVEVSREEW